MLTVTGLSKRFRGRVVLDDVGLAVAPGEITGLAGRSGVGKSTLARCLVGLETPDAGEVRLQGVAVTPGAGRARRRIQYLWQDPARALSPFLSAQAAVLETLNGFRIGAPATRRARAAELLGALGIGAGPASRRPHALSGGQCQRVALAKALAAGPDVLILDEPFSALDLATQLDVIGTLQRLHAQIRTSMLVISHDPAVLRRLTDCVLTLENGRLGRSGSTDAHGYFEA